MKKILQLTLILVTIIVSTTSYANPTNDTVAMGSSYANDVFYSLSTGVVKTVPRNNWDIAFYTTRWSAGIKINDGTGVLLYTYPKGDTTAWNNIDTIGINTWKSQFNNDTIWEDGAFNRKSLGHPDYGWGVYNMITHDVVGDSLYILRLANGSLKKVWIQRKKSTTNTYFFRFANINGSDLKTEILDVNPYTNRIFVYYSITNKTLVDREPAIESWDLLWSRYATVLADNLGVLSNYIVVGVANNLTVSARKHHPVSPVFELWHTKPLKATKTPIGHDWKSFNMTTFAWAIQDSAAYFVKTRQGNIYKLVFKHFSGSGTGRTAFTKKLLSMVDVKETKSAIEDMRVYPNPANKNITVQFRETMNSPITLRIFDQSGRLVHSQTTSLSNSFVSFSIEHLINGLYIVESTVNGQVNRQKLIVQQ